MEVDQPEDWDRAGAPLKPMICFANVRVGTCRVVDLGDAERLVLDVGGSQKFHGRSRAHDGAVNLLRLDAVRLHFGEKGEPVGSELCFDQGTLAD